MVRFITHHVYTLLLVTLKVRRRMSPALSGPVLSLRGKHASMTLIGNRLAYSGFAQAKGCRLAGEDYGALPAE